MTTTVTTTTVPCSYYLSAQARSVEPGPLVAWPDLDFWSSFGHSPECSVYADDRKAHPVVDGWDGRIVGPEVLKSEDDKLKSAFHFSKCGSNAGNFPRDYIPPGVSNTHYWGGPFEDYYCCGACTLEVREIRLLYFPASTTYSCSGHSVNTTSQNGMPSNHNRLDKRIKSLLNNGSTLITDGYTL